MAGGPGRRRVGQVGSGIPRAGGAGGHGRAAHVAAAVVAGALRYRRRRLLGGAWGLHFLLH